MHPQAYLFCCVLVQVVYGAGDEVLVTGGYDHMSRLSKMAPVMKAVG